MRAIVTMGSAATGDQAMALVPSLRLVCCIGSGHEGGDLDATRTRGIDEAALIDTLQRGVIGGARLDVFEHESDVPAALLALPNVLALPHIGGASRDAQAATQAMVLAHLDAFFAGAPLRTPVQA